MKYSTCIIIILVLVPVFLCYGCKEEKEITMKKDPEEIEHRNRPVLTITWQRLVDENSETCARCGSTGEEVEKAFKSLEKSLDSLGIETVLERKALDAETCGKDISQSNRILINGRLLEEWLGAASGRSSCESCCEKLDSDGVECRTVEVDGRVFETIPAELIVKAGLQAASELMNAKEDDPCCPKKPEAGDRSRSCCPESVGKPQNDGKNIR